MGVGQVAGRGVWTHTLAGSDGFTYVTPAKRKKKGHNVGDVDLQKFRNKGSLKG